ncbi:zinc-dependent alcohol dehydrogenase [Halorubrum sp. DTA98]|uniref:zinc-dependent alcohol dehydrogenase n=1 Tax=Halorubrum sp. DTA98 TaxID=3402163 RepID=UPI003AAEC4E7
MNDAALYFTAPETVEIRSVTVGSPDESELLVDTRVSAISAGTEMLVYRDETPSGLPADETIDGLGEEFSYPIRYGYAASGVVSDVGADVDPDWLGRTVFSFAPHQTRFRADPDDVVPLSEETSPETGALVPSVETATNVVLDAAPRIGERVVVLGAGVIGLCVTRLLASFPLAELVAVDPIGRRRGLALEMGADRATTPEEVVETVDDADLVIELSGRPAALNDAIDVVGYDARIVVGSWYGTKREPIDLGGRFHRDRIDIVSTQVSTISPELRGRWSRERRLDTALNWVNRIDVDELITHRVPFERAAEAYDLLDSEPEAAVQVVLEYR